MATRRWASCAICADEFKRVFDDFRQGYVLRYRPQGVKREGWHEIAVSVPGQPKYVVRARRGYAIEAAPPAAPPKRAAPGAIPSGLAPETVNWLAEMYELGDYAAFTAGLDQLTDLAKVIRDFRAAGNPWPAAPRRDAAFGLEIAMAGLSRTEGNARREATTLLQDYATLLRRPFGADAFECLWYWTAIAGIEGLILPALGKPFVARGLERCPDHPRLRLAEAVFADQQWPLGTLTPVPGQRFVVGPTPDQRRNVFSLYERAAAFADSAVEAGVRAAWFAFRTGDSARALALLDAAAGAGGDLQVRYLRELIRGQVLRQKQPDAAAAAYRRALEIWPAQSARVGLMTVLLGSGHRRDAEALAETIQTAPADEFDPWWMYWQGDFRVYAAIRSRLRETAR